MTATSNHPGGARSRNSDRWDTSGRIYERDGRKFTSVTTIINDGVPKPALIGWAAKMTAEFAAANPDATIEAMKAARFAVADEASAKGTALHKWVEQWALSLGDHPVPTDDPTLAKMAHQWLGLVERHEIITEATEFTVYNEALGYAGTADMVAMVDGIPSLVDVKCLGRDEPVHMADGTTRPAWALHHGDEVLAWSERDEEVVTATVKASGDNGIRPTWRVVTKCGRHLEVTEEHPFLVPAGWVKAAQLVPGQRVRVATDAPIARDDDEGCGPDDAYLLGLMVGDGSLTAACSLTATDPLIVAWLQDYADAHGLRLTSYEAQQRAATYTLIGAGPDKVVRNSVRQLIRDAGLFGHGARTKFVPDMVLRGGPWAWRYFLAGYLDTDGCVVNRLPGANRAQDRERRMVSWSSRSRQLIEQCQMMLAYLGVRSSVYKVGDVYKGRDCVQWHCAVRDQQAIEELQAVLPTVAARSTEVGDLERPPTTRRRKRQGWPEVKWDEVCSVQRLPDQPTVWIEVADHHSHVTGGLVTHNTGKDVYHDAALQLCALAHGEYIGIHNGPTLPMPMFDRCLVAHVRPTFARFYPVNVDEWAWRTFRAARAISQWVQGPSKGAILPALDEVVV